MPKPASTKARGYGKAHRKAREAARPLVEAGQATCTRCGRLIQPGSPWDLDHTPDRTGWLGPAHQFCNRSAGGRSRLKNRRRTEVPRGVFGPLSQ